MSVDPVTALSNPIGYFGRYHYANNNPYKFTDPDGRAWGLAAKLIKVIAKGGDVASTVAGAVADANVLVSRNATLGQRAMAGGSLLSEVFSPVSARDAKAVVNAIEGASESRTIYRTGSQTDGALTDASGVSFRDSLSSAADGRQTFKPGDKVFAVDTAKLPDGSVKFDGNPAGHVSVTATPDQIRGAVKQDVGGTALDGLKKNDDGSYRLPRN